MIKDLYILNNEYDIEIEKLAAEIEERKKDTSTDVKELVNIKKNISNLERELGVYRELKEKNMLEINGVIETETQKVWNAKLKEYGAYNSKAEQKVKEVINKAYNDIQVIEKEREDSFDKIDRAELNFLLSNYAKIKGKSYGVFIPNTPNTKTISELEVIRKRINWK